MAFIIGFLVVRPNISAITEVGLDNFRGIYPILTDDEEYYFARTHEVLDGNQGLGNVFIKEHKNEPFMAPPLAEIFFSSAARLSNFSIPKIFAISDFIFPFLGVIALYVLLFGVTNSKKISLGLSSFYYLLFIREAGRAINQQFIFLFLFIGIWLVWKIYAAEDNRKALFYSFWLSVIFGILLYIYPYFWTSIVATYGVCMLFKAINYKKFKEVAKNIAVFAFFSAIFSSYYFYNLFQSIKNTAYMETVRRMGLLDTHFPGAFYNTFPLLCALIFLIVIRKNIKDKLKLNFSYLLLVTGLLLNWQNVITGKYMFFSVHYLQPSYLFVVVVIGIILSEVDFGFIKEKKVILKTLLILLSASFILAMLAYKCFDGIKLALFLNVPKSQMLELQSRKDVFDWLNKNTEKDSVVYFLGNDDFRSTIPVYTHNNLYSGGCATSFLVSDEELIGRWMRQNLLNDELNESYLKNTSKTYALLANRFIDKYQNQQVRRKIIKFFNGNPGPEPELVPAWYTEMLLREYQEVKKESPEQALKKYQIDYIILNTVGSDYQKYQEKLKKLTFVELIKQFDNVLIYQVN